MNDFSTEQAPLHDREFQFLQHLVMEAFGISLGEEKRGLVRNRLGHILKRRGLSSVEEYCDSVLKSPRRDDLQELANQLSTNYTYFNRESAHYKLLAEQIYPGLVKEVERGLRSPELRMWCAAASSGEEPYQLMMSQMDFFGDRFSGWNAGLLATDISERALTLARKGVYAEEQIGKLPPGYLSRFMSRTGDGHYAVRPEVKKGVLFRHLNLTRPSYPFKRPFDVIFCRNVMIYFNNETKLGVLQRMHRWLRPGGILCIGMAESLVGEASSLFTPVAPSAYRRR
ncbi:MAG: chemotaxis protein CheR [Myxococcales bacterium]|nr:chemotaxis protein CheR [Myxococcales bacterium]